MMEGEQCNCSESHETLNAYNIHSFPLAVHIVYKTRSYIINIIHLIIFCYNVFTTVLILFKFSQKATALQFNLIIIIESTREQQTVQFAK